MVRGTSTGAHIHRGKQQVSRLCVTFGSWDVRFAHSRSELSCGEHVGSILAASQDLLRFTGLAVGPDEFSRRILDDF